MSGLVKNVTTGVTSFWSPELRILLVAAATFLILSPGFVLTLPQNTKDYCQYTLGVGDCATSGTHCAQCSKFWVASSTNTTAIWIHLLFFLPVFVILSALLV